jgi:hypothetical protein
MPECLGDLPCLHLLELLAPPPTQPPCKQRVRFVRLQCPATPKVAVHHQCITGTAFGGIPRTPQSRRKLMVEPNLAIRRHRVEREGPGGRADLPEHGHNVRGGRALRQGQAWRRASTPI